MGNKICKVIAMSAMAAGLSACGKMQAFAGSTSLASAPTGQRSLGVATATAPASNAPADPNDPVSSPTTTAASAVTAATAAATTETAFALGLYQPLLGRAASNSEATNWATVFLGASAPTCAGTAVTFLGSTEFSARNLELDSTQFVTALYQGLLSRAPDSTFISQLTAGTITRQQVVDAILKSSEFNGLCLDDYGFPNGAGGYTMPTAVSTPAPTPAPAPTPPPPTTQTVTPPTPPAPPPTQATSPLQITDPRMKYIASLYPTLLDRDISLDELLNWEKQFVTNPALAECSAATDVVLNSSEFMGLETSLQPGDFVFRLYAGLLERTPDSDGLAGWSSALSSHQLTPDQVIQGFVNSAEFISDCTTTYGFSQP